MGLIKTNNPKIELKTIISDSKLSDEQKELWHSFIGAVPEQEAVSIFKAVQADIIVLDFLTKNLEEKLKAVRGGDKNAWEDIIKKEKEFIESK